MAYTPTEWATGDVITAEKLNNIEGGVMAAGPLIVNLSYSSVVNDRYATGSTLDKSYSEIMAAYESGRNIVIVAKHAEFGTIESIKSQIIEIYQYGDYYVEVGRYRNSGSNSIYEVVVTSFSAETEDGVLTVG